MNFTLGRSSKPIVLASIHIPKTGGTSFGELLKAEYGPRLMLDYDGLASQFSPDTIAERERRKAEVMARRDEIIADFDCIHGHFIADKYQGFVPDISFVAFFRDPYQQALSNYHYLLRNPQIDHPSVRMFHEQKMTLPMYLSWEFSGNVQTIFLGEVALDELEVVGITEQFSRSVALFNATFGRKLDANVFSNVNVARPGESYPVDTGIMNLVKRFRARDIELYQHALERFESQCSRRL